MRIISGKARGTKLYTLEGDNTRPTLDRVKESIFNIIQQEIQETIFLDLFSGSGSIGLEAISRGAKKAILCDKSHLAINIIKKNVEKTKFENQTLILEIDYEKALKTIKEKVDFIYLDPPYKTDFVSNAIKLIIDNKIIHENTKIIIETDEKERIYKEISNLNLEILDERKYGRAYIIFAKVTSA